jgi:hypothetical protein
MGIKIYDTTSGAGVSSVGITDGDLVDSTGGPITASGNITVNVDLSEAPDMTDSVVGSTDELILLDSSVQKRKALNEINLGQFNNDQNWNNYVHPTTSGNKHVPSGGTTDDYLKWSSDGTAIWAPKTITAADVSDFDTEVSNNTSVAANTAKVTNSNHTGDATGATALTLAAVALTGKAAIDTVSSTDSILLNDDGVGLRKATMTQLDTYFSSSLSFVATGHTHSATDITTGTLAVANGGTGTTTSTGTGNVVLHTAPTFSGAVTGRGIAVAGGKIISNGSGSQSVTNTWGISSCTINAGGFDCTLSNGITIDDDMVILATPGDSAGIVSSTVLRVSDTVFRLFIINSSDATVTTSGLVIYFAIYDAGL